MNAVRICDNISYIPATEDPLSADIGIIRDNGVVWLYDVGNGEDSIAGLGGEYNVVLSHFHGDHVGNIDKCNVGELYLSKETYAHVGRGTVVQDGLTLGDLRIFPLPSSHARGCLGLEVDGQYAFVGDALYCRTRNGRNFYNPQLLKEEIEVLKTLRAPFLLVSHFDGLVRKKEEVIAELEAIYQLRDRNSMEIPVR